MCTTMSQPEEINTTPAWLEETQNRSWEPEILISGLTLTSLFIFPVPMFNFFASLTQDLGLDYMVSNVLFLYAGMVINTLKASFIIHLVMRFIWTALVGMSYVFPDGVIRENLMKRQKGFEYRKPVHLVMQMERWCSLIFAIPMSFAVTMLVMTVFLFLITFTAIQFNLGKEAFFIGAFAIGISSVLVGYVIKKTRISIWLNQSITNTVGAIFQTNMGKYSYLALMFSFLVIAVPFILSDQKGFSQFNNVLNTSESSEKWPSSEEIYAEHHPESRRVPRAFIPNMSVIEKYIPLSVAYYKEDEILAKALSTGERSIPDSLEWGTTKTSTDLIRVYLDDSLVTEIQWSKMKMEKTDQKIFTTFLSTEGLSEGQHQIRIAKLTYFDFVSIKRWRIRKKWAVIPFQKVPY